MYLESWCSVWCWEHLWVNWAKLESHYLISWPQPAKQWWSSRIGLFGMKLSLQLLINCFYFATNFQKPHLTNETKYFPIFNRLSPLGVFFLVVAKIIEMDSLAIIVGKLGAYFCTVMLGLIIHGFGTIAVIFFVCCHKLPYRYISQMGQNLATAFGTGSRYDYIWATQIQNNELYFWQTA